MLGFLLLVDVSFASSHMQISFELSKVIRKFVRGQKEVGRRLSKEGKIKCNVLKC